MADFTSTTNFALKKPTVGQAEDLWGVYINSNFDAIDQELQTLTNSITTPDLEGLGNVLNTTPATNDFLRFNGESWKATTVTIPSSIDDLSDVDTSTTAPTTGQALVWSGSSWTPSTPTAATITDGSITTAKLDTGLQTQLGRILVTDDDDSPTANQILKYNSTDAVWEYADLPGSTLVTLGDVDSAALADDSLLVYNSTAGEFQFESGATLRTTLGVDSAGTDNSTDISISSSTSYDYITLSAGQVLTINQVNLGTDVTGSLPIAQGGTGQVTAATARVALLPTLTGNGSKLVVVNSGATDIEYVAESTLSITESQITDLQPYLTAETNDLTAVVTWANVPDANITQSSITQHQAALSITESQISDFGSYQTSDAGLTSIAGLTTAVDQMIYTTASDTYAVTSLTSFARTILDDADASAVIGTLGLTSLYATAAQGALADSATQPGDLATTLNVSATDKLLGRSTAGAGAVEEITLTSAGRALLDDADNSAQRTTLGLGTISTQASTAVDIDGGAIDGVTIGTNAVVTDLRVDNLQLDGNTISSTDTNGNVAISPNGTGNVTLGNFTFDADQTVGLSEDNYVLTYDHSTTSISLEAATGGSASVNYIEHSSTVSDSLAISAGTNRMYVGRTDFSSGGVTMAGTLVMAGGYANFTSASALNITGTLNVI